MCWYPKTTLHVKWHRNGRTVPPCPCSSVELCRMKAHPNPNGEGLLKMRYRGWEESRESLALRQVYGSCQEVTSPSSDNQVRSGTRPKPILLVCFLPDKGSVPSSVPLSLTSPNAGWAHRSLGWWLHSIFDSSHSPLLPFCLHTQSPKPWPLSHGHQASENATTSKVTTVASFLSVSIFGFV